MHVAILLGGFAVLILLAFQFSARRGKVFGKEVKFAVFGFPVVTVEKRRWNELVTVREVRPYVGTREAYLECRQSGDFFLGIAVWVEQHRREVETNSLIRVMCLGDSLNAEEVDAAFPAHLAYGKQLGRGGRMFGAGL
jgi:hypothetical protein